MKLKMMKIWKHIMILMMLLYKNINYMKRYIKTFENFSNNKQVQTVDLYHGCSEYSVNYFIQYGWKPRHIDSIGSNMGRGDLLYLSSFWEDALWFAQEKGESSIIKVKNIPISYLIFDPEDGDPDLYDYKIENAITTIKKGELPVKLALTKPLSKEHFEIFFPK